MKNKLRTIAEYQFFKELVEKHNMRIVEQKEIQIGTLIDRNNNVIIDTISIFEKNG
jgi:hypothetical protein